MSESGDASRNGLGRGCRWRGGSGGDAGRAGLTLGELVLQFDLSLENVGGGPGLGEGDALGGGVLGFDVTSDGVALVVARSGYLELDVVGRSRLFHGDASTPFPAA